MNKIKQIHLSQFSQNKTALIIKCDNLLPPRFPLHSHDYFELELIVKGTGHQIINGKKYPLRPGMFYLLTPSTTHTYFVKKEVEIWNISFEHSLLPDLFNSYFSTRYEELVFYLEELESNMLFNLIKYGYYEYTSHENPPIDILNSILSITLQWIIRAGNLTTVTPTAFNSPVDKAIAYLKLYFSNNPSLEKTASQVYVSPSYLSTMIKKTTGLSYTDYLSNLKISSAKKMLRNTNEPITKIAEASGFESICNFNRTFRKKANMSPSEYRKKHQQPKV